MKLRQRLLALACPALIVATAGLGGPAPAQGAEAALRSGLPRGAYTGAGQVMVIQAGEEPHYRDRLGIYHIEILAAERLKATFPSSTGIPEDVELQLSATQPRATWTARRRGDTYRVTAIPFSPAAYVFRLEILREGKLVAGSQQFYAIKK